MRNNRTSSLRAPLLLLAAVFFLCAAGAGYILMLMRSPEQPAYGDFTPAVSAASVEPSHEPVPESSFEYQPFIAPRYIRDFLSENFMDDYFAVLTALYSGKAQVSLSAVSTTAEWENLRRAVQVAFPPRDLLYDAHYYNGSGPFSFDENARTLTIRYGWEESTPTVCDRDAYLAAVNAFRADVESIFSMHVSDISNPVTTAAELYDYVSDTLSYKLDMKLSLYDAFTTQEAYCQTYSQMYQFLMWQAGYECYTYGDGDATHAWNVIELNGSFYHVDTTWQSTANVLPRYYFAMSDDWAEITEHGLSSLYSRVDPLADSSATFPCLDRSYDKIYRK